MKVCICFGVFVFCWENGFVYFCFCGNFGYEFVVYYCWIVCVVICCRWGMYCWLVYWFVVGGVFVYFWCVCYLVVGCVWFGWWWYGLGIDWFGYWFVDVGDGKVVWFGIYCWVVLVVGDVWFLFFGRVFVVGVCLMGVGEWFDYGLSGYEDRESWVKVSILWLFWFWLRLNRFCLVLLYEIGVCLIEIDMIFGVGFGMVFDVDVRFFGVLVVVLRWFL